MFILYHVIEDVFFTFLVPCALLLLFVSHASFVVSASRQKRRGTHVCFIRTSLTRGLHPTLPRKCFILMVGVGSAVLVNVSSACSRRLHCLCCESQGGETMCDHMFRLDTWAKYVLVLRAERKNCRWTKCHEATAEVFY